MDLKNEIKVTFSGPSWDFSFDIDMNTKYLNPHADEIREAVQHVVHLMKNALSIPAEEPEAKKAAEAVMPLKPLPNGDLGVQSCNPPH